MLWRVKRRALVTHALFSLVLISGFLLAIRYAWYPGPLFGLERVREGLEILVPVDAILGPLLTFYLWDPHKKGVKFDIAVVLVLQVSALLYGGHTIYQQRPAVFAFAGDRFEIIPASHFDRTKLPVGMFPSPLPEPLVVYALPAQTREEQNVFVLGNVQYQKMPERYRPVHDYWDTLLAHAVPQDRIAPAEAADLARWRVFQARHRNEPVTLFRLEGTTALAIMVAVDDTGRIRDYLDLDPWESVHEPKRP